MKQITLTAVIDPTRWIVAVKNLRQASRPPEGAPGEVMGLKAAKDVVDALTGSYGREPSRAESVVVWDLAPIRESFLYFAEPTKTVPKELVIEFILDALAYSDPESAQRVLQLKSYRLLAEALR